MGRSHRGGAFGEGSLAGQPRARGTRKRADCGAAGPPLAQGLLAPIASIPVGVPERKLDAHTLHRKRIGTVLVSSGTAP